MYSSKRTQRYELSYSRELTSVFVYLIQAIFRHGEHSYVCSKFLNQHRYYISSCCCIRDTDALRGHFLSRILETKSNNTPKFAMLLKFRMQSRKRGDKKYRLKLVMKSDYNKRPEEKEKTIKFSIARQTGRSAK